MAAEVKASIGFIGVGNMGSRMAQRLVNAGYALTVCDTSDAALAAFAKQGVGTTKRAADLAGCDYVCVVVANDAQLLAVTLTDDGIRGGLGDGKKPVIVVMSTVMPETVRQVADMLAPQGVRVMDAPISGGLHGAAEGTLAIMVGGEKADYDAAAPMLRAMGQNLFHCGALGTGEITKIINNMVGVTNMYLVAEAYEIALKHGLDLAKLAPVMEVSSGRTFMSQDIATTRAQYTAWADSRPAFDSLADIIRKDLSLAAKLGQQGGLELPVLDGAVKSMEGIDETVFQRWNTVAKS